MTPRKRRTRTAKLQPSYHTMSAEEYQKLHPRFPNELAFEKWVIKILKANGWRVTSMKDSRKQMWGTDRGIPDIIAAHLERGLLFAELKMPGKQPTPDQKKWLDVLMEVSYHYLDYGDPVVIKVWRPENEEEIIEFAGGKLPL